MPGLIMYLYQQYVLVQLHFQNFFTTIYDIKTSNLIIYTMPDRRTRNEAPKAPSSKAVLPPLAPPRKTFKIIKTISLHSPT